MASRGTKLCSYFYFYSLYNILKDQLYRISRSWFYEWLFGPEKFSGLSRNGPLITKGCCATGIPSIEKSVDESAERAALRLLKLKSVETLRPGLKMDELC